MIGLPLPSENFLVQQLLLNYLPTVISTIIEPFWVVLNRLLCLFQPFEQLRRGNAPPSTSLNLRYTSIPPPLVLWRALRAKHFLLAAVCGMALLANVLTIALSGLFNQSFVYMSEGLLLRQLHIATTKPRNTWHNSGVTMDNFYVADSNITSGTPLPPWVTPDRYFVPFELPLATDTTTRYQGITTAIMAELQCEELHNSHSKHLFNFTLSDYATFIRITTSHYQPDGGIRRCQATNQNYQIGPDHQVGVEGNPEGIKAAEILATMLEYNGTGIAVDVSAERAFCEKQILAGWIRSNITLEVPTSNDTQSDSARKTTSVAMDQMFMVCRPRFSNATFEVTVDSLGTVLNSRPAKSDVTITNITALFSVADRLWDAFAQRHNSIWHNDTFATDWASYLIKQLTHSSAILDPRAPVPLFTPTAALFGEVYRRAFATLVSVNSVWSLPEASSNVTTNAIPAAAITGHWRVFMNPTMFTLAITILSLDLAVAAWLYAARPKAFLPRLPTSLASVIATFAAGEVVQDLRTKTGQAAGPVSVEEQMVHLESKGWKFGYGKLFPGKDGRTHFGIERVPFFTPLQADDRARGKSSGRRRRLGRIWRPGTKE